MTRLPRTGRRGSACREFATTMESGGQARLLSASLRRLVSPKVSGSSVSCSTTAVVQRGKRYRQPGPDRPRQTGTVHDGPGQPWADLRTRPVAVDDHTPRPRRSHGRARTGGRSSRPRPPRRRVRPAGAAGPKWGRTAGPARVARTSWSGSGLDRSRRGPARRDTEPAAGAATDESRPGSQESGVIRGRLGRRISSLRLTRADHRGAGPRPHLTGAADRYDAARLLASSPVPPADRPRDNRPGRTRAGPAAAPGPNPPAGRAAA